MFGVGRGGGEDSDGWQNRENNVATRFRPRGHEPKVTNVGTGLYRAVQNVMLIRLYSIPKFERRFEFADDLLVKS